jgi:hypothetical protein
VVLDGAGVTGDSTGITTTQCSTTAGTTPGAERSTTGAVLPEEAAGAVGSTAGVAEAPGLSTETGRQLEDTLHREVRVASAPAPTVVTIMADRQRAIPHAEAPVWGRVAVEEEDFVAAGVAGMVAVVDVASLNLGMAPGGV